MVDRAFPAKNCIPMLSAELQAPRYVERLLNKSWILQSFKFVRKGFQESLATKRNFELENALDQWLTHSVTDCPTLEPEKINLNGQSTEYSASKVHALGQERVQTPRSSTITGVLREGVWVQVHACLDQPDCNSLQRSSCKCGGRWGGFGAITA